MSKIVINNSADATAKSATWSNPGAVLYDLLMKQENWKELLTETYLRAPVSKITPPDGERYTGTSFTRSDVGFPHHVVKGGQLVIHEGGLRAAYSRTQQMDRFTGAVKDHLIRHYKELGWFESSSISDEENIAHMDQPRDEQGRFASFDGGGGSSATASMDTPQLKAAVDRLQLERQFATLSLGDAQLKAIVERMELNKKFKELSKEQKTAFQKITAKVLETAGDTILKAAASVMEQRLKEGFKAMLSGEEPKKK